MFGLYGVEIYKELVDISMPERDTKKESLQKSGPSLAKLLKMLGSKPTPSNGNTLCDIPLTTTRLAENSACE